MVAISGVVGLELSPPTRRLATVVPTMLDPEGRNSRLRKRKVIRAEKETFFWLSVGPESEAKLGGSGANIVS